MYLYIYGNRVRYTSARMQMANESRQARFLLWTTTLVGPSYRYFWQFAPAPSHAWRSFRRRRRCFVVVAATAAAAIEG